MAAATNVTIIGGFSALPATVETTMKTLRSTATISRISGGDRYSTAANVASNIVNTAGGSLAAVNGKKSVFLASGTSFADAVIAAPLQKKQLQALGPLAVAAGPEACRPLRHQFAVAAHSAA